MNWSQFAACSAPGSRYQADPGCLGALRLHRDRHVDLTRPGRWAALLTNKLYYTRDRQPLTEIRNAFRELTFG
ncbi:hypothetical protein ACRAWF_00540 [Streptomyces sp. L7]